MGAFKFRRAGARIARRKRGRIFKSALLIALLALVGALLDPSILPPIGPTATRPQRINASFTRCGQGRSMACVVDGDTIRLGQRRGKWGENGDGDEADDDRLFCPGQCR